MKSKNLTENSVKVSPLESNKKKWLLMDSLISGPSRKTSNSVITIKSGTPQVQKVNYTKLFPTLAKADKRNKFLKKLRKMKNTRSTMISPDHIETNNESPPDLADLPTVGLQEVAMKSQSEIYDFRRYLKQGNIQEKTEKFNLKPRPALKPVTMNPVGNAVAAMIQLPELILDSEPESQVNIENGMETAMVGNSLLGLSS
jgi:hypothetical protein